MSYWDTSIDTDYNYCSWLPGFKFLSSTTEDTTYFGCMTQRKLSPNDLKVPP